MIGAGWKDLADAAIVMCKIYKVRPVQIKEKFGLLRIYVDPAQGIHDAVNDFLFRLEEYSGTICENCGKPRETVKIVGGHWIKTLCPSCREVDFSKSVSYNLDAGTVVVTEEAP